MMMKIKSPYLLVLILWLCSIAIRIPQLNRPLSKHHEFVTAHVLRIMKIWNQQGASHFHFNPVMSYDGAANKFINNQTTENFDTAGNAYYLSYPPLSFIAPYFLFGGWIQTPTALSLLLFNLLLHLIECLLLYQICLLLCRSCSPDQQHKIGVIAVLVHLFSPCLLWFHGNVYCMDMPALTLWLLCVWLWLKNSEAIISNQNNRGVLLTALFICSFLLSYTEYLGVAFAFTVFAYSLFNRKYFLPAIRVCAGTVCALLLMVYQYSLIGGMDKLMSFVQSRYAERSGYSNHFSFSKIIGEWGIVGMNYLTGFAPWILLLACLIFLHRKKIFSQKFFNHSIIQFSIVLIVPVLLHHILFLNAAGHDFHQMKASPFFAIAIALGYVSQNERWKKNLFSIILLANIFLFYWINPPGKVSLTGDSYSFFLEQGKFIHENAKDDEVVFLNGISDEPQLVWYAQRNLRTIQSADEAIRFLKMRHLLKGIIFTRDRNQLIKVQQHLELAQ